MMIEQLLLSQDEAARALGISKRAVQQMTTDGVLTVVRMGRTVRYYVDDLRAWIERQTNAAARVAWWESQYPGVEFDEDGNAYVAMAEPEAE